jgi:hypothetical protein
MQKIPLRSPNGPHLSVRAGFAIKWKMPKTVAALGIFGGASDVIRTRDLLITSGVPSVAGLFASCENTLQL